MKKKTVIVLLILFALVMLALVNAVIICQYGNVDEKQKCDVAIVLGAATYANGISPVYAERINHGIWLYENGYVDYIIVTGGKLSEKELSDDYKAKQYAISKGVSGDVIFVEENSRITQENLKFSKEIMANNQWDSCIIVSDPLHMKRAMAIAESYDMKAFSSPTLTSRYKTWKKKLPFLLREEFYYIGYKIYSFFNEVM